MVFLEMVGACFIVALSLMVILGSVYLFKKNAGLLDLGWPLSFILTMLVCWLIGQGWSPRKWLLAGMVWIWAGWLFYFIYQRFINTEEDSRYQTVRIHLGNTATDFKFFLLFLLQAVLVVILSLPFMITSMNTFREWYVVEGWGLVIWLIGITGEAIADYQLVSFRKVPSNQGKVCRMGLWNYCRHPNYFFEFITWIGFFIFSLSTPWGIFSIISLVLMVFLLLKVAIPWAEELALKKMPTEYEDYQQTTNTFIPWFRKIAFF